MLKFTTDQYNIINNNNDLIIYEADIVSTGTNYNDANFSIESIQDAKSTLSNIPIICIFDSFDEDFEEHARDKYDKDQIKIIGNVPESHNGIIVEKDKKQWQRLKFIIWKSYIPKNILKRLVKNQNIKISMEIKPIKVLERDDGILDIQKFEYKSICLLGEKYTPAIPNASAKLIKFSSVEYKNKCNEYNNIFSKINTYSIPENVKNEISNINSKNPVVVRYFSHISNKRNIDYKDIVHINSITNECYELTKKWCKSIIDYSDKDVEIDDVKDSADNKALNHINTNRKELKMKKLEKFSATYNNLIGMATQIIKDKEVDEYGIQSYSVMDIDEANVYCNKSGYTVAISYAMEEEKIKIDFESEKKVMPVVDYVNVKEDQNDDNLQNYYSSSREVLNTIKTELEDIKTKYSALQQTNEALQNFKNETENKQKQDNANTLYEKYKDFINKEDVENFNKVLFSVENFDVFQEKFSNFVLPKVEAAIKSRPEKKVDEKNKTNSLDFNLFGITKDDTKKIDKDDIFKKLESI